MRAFVPTYQLISPANLSEALDVLARDQGVWHPFAGGTDLMVLLEAGKLPHKNYLNIWNLSELRGIEINDSQVTLGALTTYTEIQDNETLRAEFPMLCQAASETGGLAIQNRGTMGGNIVNASPAADSPPALLAYDAELELVSAKGARTIPYHSFHTGYKEMDIRGGRAAARDSSAPRDQRVAQRADALLPQGRHAQGPGHLESLFRRSGADERGSDRRRSNRVGQRSAHPDPLCADGKRSAPPDNQYRDPGRREVRPEGRDCSHRRSAIDQRLPAQVSLNLLEDFLHQVAGPGSA